MERNAWFGRMADEWKLGALTARPQRVAGGYMHKMYKLETTSGKYAVKLLNPMIMKRPDAFWNFRRAERLEGILEKNDIPVVPALEFEGRKMQRMETQYFYVFEWLEGKALGWEEIQKGHCETVGALLAAIHKIECPQRPFAAGEISIDWDFYMEQADEACPEIAKELKKSRELLYSAQKAFNFSIKNVPAVTCICDGDMDSKNILWVDGKPRIIDLESLDYGNPFPEMFQLALSWSGSVICRMDYELLNAFLTAYRREYGDFDVSWETLSGVGFGWLEWLEYNIRRVLPPACEDEEERRLGIREARETLRRIMYYASVREELPGRISAEK